MKQIRIYLIVASLLLVIALGFAVYVWAKLQSLEDTRIYSPENFDPSIEQLRKSEDPQLGGSVWSTNSNSNAGTETFKLP